MKKTLAIILAMLMCLSVMVSCGGKTDDPAATTTAAQGGENTPADTTTTVETTESPYDVNGYLKDSLDPNLNYNGDKFTILFWKDVERIEFEVEEMTGDLIGDALYNRNAAVEDRLNIEFEWVGTAGNYNNQADFVAQVDNDVKSGGEYEVFAGYSMSAATIALQGLSRNLMEVDNIDLSKPWWPSSLTELTTINDRLYFCSGDISTNMLHMMYCTLFNKELAEELKVGNVYEMVDNGTWTIDKMSELASTAYSDLNGDTVRDTGDRYGIAIGSNIHFDAFFTASGLRTVTKDANGTPVMAEEFASEKTHALLEKIVQLFHETDYTAFAAKVTDWSNKPFAEGRVLFIVDRNYVTSSTTFADTAVTYGVLPVPKYEESQENYYTCMAFPFSIYSVSIALSEEKANMAGAVLECMGSESYRQVTPAVFETAMKLKYSAGEDDSRMYDLIRETIQIDLGRIFTTPLKNISYSPFRSACNNGNTNWTSIIKAESKVMAKLLDQIVTSLDNLAAGQ
jgi:maltose-binding protein MalE